VLLSVIISDEHDRVSHYGSRYACGEAFPEAKYASLVSIDIESTLDHASVGDHWMVLVELQGYLFYLKFGLDNVLRVGN
jgi:hypothetical protein